MRLLRTHTRIPFLAAIPILALMAMGATAFNDADPVAESAEIRVSLSDRSIKLMENGEVVRTYGVAIGRPSHPTPTGTFRTGRIVWNPGWVPPNSEWARNERPRSPGDPKNPMQGVKIYFREPAYFIHGTNAPGSIGQAASHGCLRMRTEEAKAVARWIESNGGSVRMTISD
ncbi:MAG: L,D-transpeptidase [Gemmatimonadota bacterium]|jgi:lipoprotein-anchoring transpeptidase ErfK/SrfK|nr:L,D-transpeptidase [Gemmatimonadota bacterium]